MWPRRRPTRRARQCRAVGVGPGSRTGRGRPDRGVSRGTVASSGKESQPQQGRRLVSHLVECRQFCAQLAVNLALVVEVVSERRVDLGGLQMRVLPHDLFRRPSVAEVIGGDLSNPDTRPADEVRGCSFMLQDMWVGRRAHPPIAARRPGCICVFVPRTPGAPSDQTSIVLYIQTSKRTVDLTTGRPRATDLTKRQPYLTPGRPNVKYAA